MLRSGRRTLIIFLAIAVLLSLYLLPSSSYNFDEVLYRSRPQGLPPSSSLSEILGVGRGWTFDPDRDSENPALNHEQCAAAFPDLYYEIDRAASVWQNRNHTISAEDIDISWREDAAIRVLVHNNQLRVLQTKHTIEGYQPRTHATLHQLYRALMGASAAREILPDAEFAMTVDDKSLLPSDSNKTIWAYARHLGSESEERVWLMPDFNFWATPPIASSFHDMRWKALQQDMELSDKIPKVVWRGAKWTNLPVRGKLLEVTKGKDWADVKESARSNDSSPLPMEALCRYMFTVHTEGLTWSGRLGFLLNCDSVPIIHRLEWWAHYYHLLIPGGDKQNYIQVERDFSDLEESVQWLLEHPEHAARVARNTVEQFRNRYTTLAAETCYWRRLIRTWSEVAFKPELYEYVTIHNVDGKDVQERRLRGHTFEEYLEMKTDIDPPEDS